MLALSSCGNKPQDPADPGKTDTNPPVEVELTQEQLQQIAKNKIDDICTKAKQLTNAFDLNELIDNFKADAIGEINNTEFIDEDDAITFADGLADDFAEHDFKGQVVYKISNYLFNLICSTSDRTLKEGLDDIYTRDVNEMIEQDHSFGEILTRLNTINEKLANLTGDPVIQNFEEIFKQIDFDIDYYCCEYGEYIEYKDIREDIANEKKKLEAATTEEEARNLCDQVRRAIYDILLANFVHNLYLAYKNFVDDVNEGTKEESVKTEAFGSLDEDYDLILSSYDFEDGLRNYNDCYDHALYWLEHDLHTWGENQINALYDEYESQVPEEKWQELYKEYCKAAAKINALNPYVTTLEKEIKEVLTAFEQFAQNLLEE